MPFATTQEAYRILLRDHVGPALREIGFKGSGSVYIADQQNAFVTIGFERSRWGSRTATDFFINLTVAPIEGWNKARRAHPLLSQRPAPNGIYLEHIFGTGAWQSRLVMPDGREARWHLRPTTDLRRLAADVVSSVRDHALPAIAQALDARAPSSDTERR